VVGFLIWILIAVTVFGVVVWSLIITLQQKKVWKDFAKKYGFQYSAPRLTEPPMVTGTKDGTKFYFYTYSYPTNDKLYRNVLVVAEIDAPFVNETDMPPRMIILNERSAALLNAPNLTFSTQYKHGDHMLIGCDDVDAIQHYIADPKRQKAFTAMMDWKNMDVALLIDKNTLSLRFEINNALNTTDSLESVYKKLLAIRSVV
jgi:hypothetical protein